MAINTKVKQNKKDSKAINILININDSVESNANQTDKTETLVNLRIPADTLQQIDALVVKRRIKTSRHTWLMEAIYDKLEKEKE